MYRCYGSGVLVVPQKLNGSSSSLGKLGEPFLGFFGVWLAIATEMGHLWCIDPCQPDIDRFVFKVGSFDVGPAEEESGQEGCVVESDIVTVIDTDDISFQLFLPSKVF